MKVYDVEITPAQIAAGEAAMRGQFRMSDVRAALIRAGVNREAWVADRAADKLLQRNRKIGRIRTVHNKLWEACDDAR